MQLIEFGQKLNEPIVVCLGYFGCMHKGHVALLDRTKLRASQLGAKVALFTFSNNHLRVLGKDAKVLYTLEERLDIYSSVGVDYLIAAEFNEQFRANTGAQFVAMLAQYNLKGIVCGFDYTCGSDRLSGDKLRNALSQLCPVDTVEAVCWNGRKVSTTLIRELLLANDLATTNQMLTEPYFVTGKVVSGRHVGTRIGFPTANLQVDIDKLLPLGVYGGKVTLDGKMYNCIVNIGSKPTFDLENASVEVHIIAFDGNLYGQRLKVSLTKFLRAIRKFDSADELSKQLQADRESAKND